MWILPNDQIVFLEEHLPDWFVAVIFKVNTAPGGCNVLRSSPWKPNINSTLPAWNLSTTLGSSVFSKASEFFFYLTNRHLSDFPPEFSCGGILGDLSAEMWCDVMWALSFRVNVLLYFPTSLPPIYHLSEGQKRRKSSFLEIHRWQRRLRLTVVSKFLKCTAHTNTHWPPDADLQSLSSTG